MKGSMFGKLLLLGMVFAYVAISDGKKIAKTIELPRASALARAILQDVDAVVNLPDNHPLVGSRAVDDHDAYEIPEIKELRKRAAAADTITIIIFDDGSVLIIYERDA